MGDFRMPSLGAGMESGVLVAWKVAAGDAVRRGDVIAEVETEKGIIEVEVFEDGVIEELLVAPGTKLPVGAPMARLRGAEAPARAEPPRAAEPAPAAGAHRETRAEPPPAAAPAPAPRAHRETPAARQLAREEGVDLASVHGTGPHGVVTRADVVRALEPRAAAKAPHAPPAEELERLAAAPTEKRVSPLARRRARELGVDLAAVAPGPDGAVHLAQVESAARARHEDAGAAMRRAIAAAMSASKREIPHYYLAHTIDLGPALAWLERENEARPVPARLLPGVLLLKAAARALAVTPELNAHWIGASAPPIERVSLGVAISLRQGGLVAPGIPDADRLSVGGLMTAFKDLVARARRGTLRASELAGATVTVTSLGERGVETVHPIINPPQVAMVGFGKILERPWVVGGEVRPRPVVTATLAADHRVSDGHRGGLYLAEVERLLTHPEEL